MAARRLHGLLNVSRKCCQVGARRAFCSKFEPEYLSELVPQYPVYDLLNIQMKSYDFTVAEHYGSYVHKIAQRMGLEVEDSWATPPTVLQIKRYKPKTTVVDKEYTLNLYERNVQISGMPCYLTPVFFEVIRAAAPEGIEMCIRPPTEADDEIRYIPDLDLNELKDQLLTFSSPTSKGKKNK